MIRNWQHKGLKKFFETGNKSGIQPKHAQIFGVLLMQLGSEMWLNMQLMYDLWQAEKKRKKLKVKPIFKKFSSTGLAVTYSPIICVIRCANEQAFFSSQSCLAI
jgi:hypothetical protein